MSQEKSKTMPMQIVFEVEAVYYGFFKMFFNVFNYGIVQAENRRFQWIYTENVELSIVEYQFIII